MLNSAIRALGLLAVAALFVACTVVVKDPQPIPPRPPQACGFDFAPVCARRGGSFRTFDNACLARSADFRVVHSGQCSGPGGQSSRPVACPLNIAPVCAVRNGRFRTFDNSCLAEAAGFRPIHGGSCG
jgi:hypothetical protein